MFVTGEAALYILREEFGDNWPEKVKVIFAGDDTTDEDAMKVESNFYLHGKRLLHISLVYFFFSFKQSLKGASLSFRVSSHPEIETNADYRVPSTKTISLILQWLQDTLNQV